MPINLPSRDTPRWTTDDILSTVDAPGRGVRVVSISNKMVHSTGSSSLPQPGQIFTVGSISWLINADGVGELLEPEQIGSAPATPAPATADLISEPPPRSSSPTIHRPPGVRRQCRPDNTIRRRPDAPSKAKSHFNIFLNILQSPYITMMFLQTVFSMFALQMIF